MDPRLKKHKRTASVLASWTIFRKLVGDGRRKTCSNCCSTAVSTECIVEAKMNIQPFCTIYYNEKIQEHHRVTTMCKYNSEHDWEIFKKYQKIMSKCKTGRQLLFNRLIYKMHCWIPYQKTTILYNPSFKSCNMMQYANIKPSHLHLSFFSPPKHLRTLLGKIINIKPSASI